MPRGPRPKPTKLKYLGGTARADRIHKNEPQPSTFSIVPEPPDHLSDEAKYAWREVAGELHSLGLLTRIDTTALAAYCETYATWIEAITKLRKEGMIVRTPNGYPIQSPWLSIANKAATDMRRWLIEFGMTPSSRTRINVERPEEEDPYQAFLEQLNGS